MGKSSPKAPDYKGAAEQTAAGNLAALQQQTQANRNDTFTPFGSSTWSNEGNDWTNTVTLTPDMQAALDQQQNIVNNQSSLATTLQGQAAQTMSQPYVAPKYSDYVGNGPNLTSNFSGFNGSGAGVDLGYQKFNNTTGQASQNFGGFNPNVPAVNNGYQGFNADLSKFQADPNFAGMNGAGLGSANTEFSGLNSTTPQGTAGFNGFGGSDQRTNLNAPQFTTANSDAATKAAFASSMDLLKPQMEQDKTGLDNQLRLQGLTPGTEAYDNAMQNLTRSQTSQQNNIANQSVITGNNIANQNYASTLAGYGAGNQAQQQDYSQLFNNYGTSQQALANNNDALSQNFGRELQGAQFNQNSQQYGNQAQQQNFNQAQSLYQSGQQAQQFSNDARNSNLNQAMTAYQTQQQAIDRQNAAQQQAYGQSRDTYDASQQAMLANNAAQAQNYGQSAQTFGLNQDARNAYNTAQAQNYGQALGTYQTQQDAYNNQNQAEQQKYLNSVANYQNASTAAQQNYYQPLNALNAVLNGNQVAMPQFQTPNSSAGYAPGADYLSAAQLLGQFKSGAAAGQNGLMGGLIGAAGNVLGGMAQSGSFSDRRLKSNIVRVGTLKSGLGVYEYDIFGRRERGVMAQEAITKFPEAVAMHDSGYLTVDYSRIA